MPHPRRVFVLAAGGRSRNRAVRDLVEQVCRLAKESLVAFIWLTHETNRTAMKLYDKVAEKSGFIVYRKPLRECPGAARQKRARPAPRSLVGSRFNLPPMPFPKFPVIAVVNPPVRLPVGTWMWRTIPAARHPHVAVAVPIVIARDPHKAGFGRWRSALDNRRRWGDANDNLRIRCRRQKD